jgi:uncharacterized membrane protein
MMNKPQSHLNGLLMGAGLMYLMDPDRGSRRRAVLRDQVVHLLHDFSDAIETASRDLGNRTGGALAEVRSRVRRDTADDPVLGARVRSELGRLTSHPGALHVVVEGGRVTLSGPVLADEVEDLLAGVSSVRGVSEVENRLQVHESAGDVPGLQGQAKRPEKRSELMQENWAPATRLLVGVVGGALALRGMRGRGPMDPVLGLVGLGILSRSVTNLPMKRVTGLNAGRRAVDIHKTINVDAPVEEVFAFWSNYENFPLFMSHLREVRLTGGGRSHWVAEAPGGVPVAWDAETTAYRENEVIAWKSIGTPAVQNAGIVRFQPDGSGGTRVDIRLSYNPPAGAVGHAVASLFGADPKHLMDEDLVRFKSLIELGKVTADERTLTREEVGSTAGAAPTGALRREESR